MALKHISRAMEIDLSDKNFLSKMKRVGKKVLQSKFSEFSHRRTKNVNLGHRGYHFPRQAMSSYRDVSYWKRGIIKKLKIKN